MRSPDDNAEGSFLIGDFLCKIKGAVLDVGDPLGDSCGSGAKPTFFITFKASSTSNCFA